jgi:hypothetical protein
LLAGLLLLALPGCGDRLKRGQVSGTVTLDGQPVENGVITFLPTGDTRGPSTSATITEGRYALDSRQGPVVGTNRVEVLAYRKTGKKVRAMTSGGLIDEVLQAAPPAYNSQSTLERKISAGPNTLHFDLLTTPR